MITLQEFKYNIRNYKQLNIKQLAYSAQKTTQKYFGKTIELYIPIYISNYCNNKCLYCNFSADKKNIKRYKLSLEEIKVELQELKNRGFDELLILTGGRNTDKDFELLINTIKTAAQLFNKIGVEIFTCNYEQYKTLHNTGIAYVTIYQETYNKDTYNKYHISGPKRDFDIRITAPEKVFQSGIKGIGMGVLYGLNDPIEDSIALAEHIYKLRKKFWDKNYSISFPRIKDRYVEYPVDDVLFAKIIMLFRLLFPDVDLNLSTREKPDLRDKFIGIGINKLSAESSTTVGGYSDTYAHNEGQFKLYDTRTLNNIIESIKKNGYQPVFKNYDPILV